MAETKEAPVIKTAAMVVIGDEILSGRTQDKNIAYVATAIGEIGIQMREVRIIPDIEAEIVDAVNYFRAKYDYVFTSGGIGPTHDDITADSIAAAFGVGIGYHPEAYEILTKHYEQAGVEFNEARKRMARIPEGGELIDNPVSKAPGFRMENVFTMAGVPAVMQAMMVSVLPQLEGGAKMQNVSIQVSLPEGVVAKDLGELQERFPEVSMGSYPYFRAGVVGTVLVLRSVIGEQLDTARDELIRILDAQEAEYNIQ